MGTYHLSSCYKVSRRSLKWNLRYKIAKCWATIRPKCPLDQIWIFGNISVISFLWPYHSSSFYKVSKNSLAYYGIQGCKNLEPNWAKIAHLPQIRVLGDISFLLFFYLLTLIMLQNVKRFFEWIPKYNVVKFLGPNSEIREC